MTISMHRYSALVQADGHHANQVEEYTELVHQSTWQADTIHVSNTNTSCPKYV